jgi:hypothetical protein
VGPVDQHLAFHSVARGNGVAALCTPPAAYAAGCARRSALPRGRFLGPCHFGAITQHDGSA